MAAPAASMPRLRTTVWRSVNTPWDSAPLTLLGGSADCLDARPDEEPTVLTVRRAEGADRQGADALPSGPFDPVSHRTLELGLDGRVVGEIDERFAAACHVQRHDGDNKETDKHEFLHC